MKKMKIASGLMALAMAGMSLGLSAFAANGSVDVKIGKDTKKAGEEYEVTVDIDGAPSTGFSSIDFAISYDSSKVTVTDVTLGSAGNTGAASQEGDASSTLFNYKVTDDQIIIVWATGLDDSKYWVKDGTFLTISGKVKTGATGVAKFEGEAASRPSYPGGGTNTAIIFDAVTSKDSIAEYTAEFTDGSVTIDDGGSDPGNIVWGDADCNGKVLVGDAVLVARLAANDATVSADVTDEGKANADVVNDGKFTGEDVTLLCKYLARLAKYEDLGKKP